MSKFRQGKRRRMTKFRINEIAAVDFPAQTPALATILKRKGSPDYDPKTKKGRLVKREDVEHDEALLAKFDDTTGVMTSNEDGHAHILWLYGKVGETSWQKSEGEESGHDHPWMLNADGTITIGMSEGHDHAVDQSIVLMALMEKNDSNQAGDPGIEKEAEMPQTPEEVANDLKKATDENGELTKSNERLAAIVKLSADERAHFDGLDTEGQDAFLAKSADERGSEINKSTEEDPVVYTSLSGDEFRKSDDSRLIKLAKERDEDRKELAKARVERENAGFEKRAEELLPNSSGDLPVRAAIVKALDGIKDEDLRKGAFESVQAGDKALKAAFNRTGHQTVTGDEGDAETELTNLAKARAEKDECSFTDAYAKVADENPALFAKAVGSTTSN
jgi:hypothetical protein